MSDLISRQDAIDEWRRDFKEYVNELILPRDDYNGIMEYIDEAPSAERTGEWIETADGTMCSNCHRFPYDDGEYHIANWSSDFCPHCGARMVSEE